MKRLHVLLPTRERAGIDADTARQLARGDALPRREPGHLAMLQGLFSWPGTTLPAAALMRQHRLGDAGRDVWLSADPAWVEADINGARMMACARLSLDADQAERFAKPLRPLFGDRGMLLELTTPERWHLRLAPGTPVPNFDAPDRAIGADLLAQFEQAGDKRWRALFTEVQTELHGNPANAARRERGETPFNALWLWGGGALPDWVKTRLETVASDDALVQALASQAGIAAQPRARFDADAAAEEALLDLGEHALEPGAWQAILELLRKRRTDELRLHFADGHALALRRAHRWRIWRRP